MHLKLQRHFDLRSYTFKANYIQERIRAILWYKLETGHLYCIHLKNKRFLKSKKYLQNHCFWIMSVNKLYQLNAVWPPSQTLIYYNKIEMFQLQPMFNCTHPFLLSIVHRHVVYRWGIDLLFHWTILMSLFFGAS